ncbi:MAG: hypothetical protein PHY93_07020 [Bacteriovorax sp.]|nr:hypothetical protein [Bacteriovorax sp.]
MDFFKMGELFLNFMMGQRRLIGERSQEISVEILNQVRRVLILVVITLGALTMFCMGMGHLIERVLNKLDAGSFVFTPAIGVILLFLVICIGVLIYSTNKNVWLNIFKIEKIQKEEAPQNAIGVQIESVVSLLILDFIKERECKREERKEHSKENRGGHNE